MPLVYGPTLYTCSALLYYLCEVAWLQSTAYHYCTPGGGYCLAKPVLLLQTNDYIRRVLARTASANILAAVAANWGRARRMFDNRAWDFNAVMLALAN